MTREEKRNQKPIETQAPRFYNNQLSLSSDVFANVQSPALVCLDFALRDLAAPSAWCSLCGDCTSDDVSMRSDVLKKLLIKKKYTYSDERGRASQSRRRVGRSQQGQQPEALVVTGRPLRRRCGGTVERAVAPLQ